MALNLFSLPGVDNPANGNNPNQGPTTQPEPPSGSVPTPPPIDFGSLVEGAFGSPGSTGNPAAAKAAALRGVDIERQRLGFQQETGLRDIEQARDEGLRAAINNALQRGIYRSGIRIENEQRVGREADEAASDLKTEIGFALDLLKSRADQIRAGGGGAGVSGFGFDMINAIQQWLLENGVQLFQPGGAAPPGSAGTGNPVGGGGFAGRI